MEASLGFVPIILIFPVAGLLINALWGRWLGNRGAGVLASLMSGLSFVIAVVALGVLAARGYEGENVVVYDWIVAGPLQLRAEFLVDSLAVTMALLVSGVGTLIHIYSIGYMANDPRATRFFVYMNLFIVSMLILVLGGNYALLFVGWELVGLCSYLLIGFWYDRGPGGIGNAIAAKKAFVVNRVGDFGFILGLFLIWTVFGTLNFGEIFAQIGGGEGGEHLARALAAPAPVVFTAIALLLLIGATGKSAQIPLWVWLPDAMAGPTPVSALIHAATMVTAGIYMITRSHPIFNQAPDAQAVVALIGATTALVAGTIAVAQFDIKRVLAFSTISQLGFMIAAVGLGAYVAGMFHLLTHAFFKALLFLGSGSVIHAMEHGEHEAHAAHAGHGAPTAGLTVDDAAQPHPPHAAEAESPREKPAEPLPFDPQDMRHMGGLLRRMPVTGWTYIVGALALAGIVPLAGFWSKDEILGEAYLFGFGAAGAEGFAYPWVAQAVFVLLLIAAGFTAFYMMRQVWMVFFGAPRSEAARHAPENAAVMTGPLVVLAILAAIGGLLNLPVFDAGAREQAPAWAGALARFLEHAAGGGLHGEPGVLNYLIAGAALLVAALTGGLGYLLYRPAFGRAEERDPLERTGPLFVFLRERWYWDWFYEVFIIRPYKWIARQLAFVVDARFWNGLVHDTVIIGAFYGWARLLSQPVDRGLVDGLINWTARLIGVGAERLRPVQSGYVRSYALGVLFGVVLLVAYFVWLAAA
jgi:NADH-quinone oxidoreductase subunit L